MSEADPACEATLAALERLHCDLSCSLTVALARQAEIMRAVQSNIDAIRESLRRQRRQEDTP